MCGEHVLSKVCVLRFVCVRACVRACVRVYHPNGSASDSSCEKTFLHLTVEEGARRVAFPEQDPGEKRLSFPLNFVALAIGSTYVTVIAARIYICSRTRIRVCVCLVVCKEKTMEPVLVCASDTPSPITVGNSLSLQPPAPSPSSPPFSGVCSSSSVCACCPLSCSTPSSFNTTTTAPSHCKACKFLQEKTQTQNKQAPLQKFFIFVYLCIYRGLVKQSSQNCSPASVAHTYALATPHPLSTPLSLNLYIVHWGKGTSAAFHVCVCVCIWM